MVLAKYSSSILPKSFLLQLKIPGHYKINKHRKTLKEEEEIRLSKDFRT